MHPWSTGCMYPPTTSALHIGCKAHFWIYQQLPSIQAAVQGSCILVHGSCLLLGLRGYAASRRPEPLRLEETTKGRRRRTWYGAYNALAIKPSGAHCLPMPVHAESRLLSAWSLVSLGNSMRELSASRGPRD